jgi:hypothetical protein
VEISYVLEDIEISDFDKVEPGDLCAKSWVIQERYILFLINDLPEASSLISLYIRKNSISGTSFYLRSFWLNEPQVYFDTIKMIDNINIKGSVFQDAFTINDTENSDTIYEESMYRFNQAVIAKDGGLVKLWNTILDKGLILKEIR